MIGLSVVTCTAARALFEKRRERDRRLGQFAPLMGEPAWDMLLYLASRQAGEADQAEAMPGPALPAEIGIHWIAVLHKLGLVDRLDLQGGSNARLSPAGVHLMEQVLVDA